MERNPYTIPSGRPEWGKPAAVVVPNAEHVLQVSSSIAPGSGIVAFRVEEAPTKLVLYYEGNIYDAVNLRAFQQRVHQSYGRMTARYGTIAQSMLPAEWFTVVGAYSPEKLEIDEMDPDLRVWKQDDRKLVPDHQARPARLI
jgi:hypothetical protein